MFSWRTTSFHFQRFHNQPCGSPVRQMSSYDEVVAKDLELLWSIQEFCYRTPWINDRMSKIISKNPLRDIVSILWIFFILGIVELKEKHFWVVTMNLAASFVARTLIEAKRPVEYDIRLQPLTDTRAESYGFPSLESYMSVVIMGHLFLSFKSIWLLPLGAVVVFIIGFSRVYSRSRFPHQIVGSWLAGLVGLVVSMHCCEKMSFHKMSFHQHGVCVMVIVLGVVCNFALNLENNESRLMQIPREEFVRVMSDIISGGDKNASSSVDVSTTDDEAFYDPMDPTGENGYLQSHRTSSTNRSSVVGETPRTTATKQAQTRVNPAAGAYANMNGTGALRRNRRVKSDSLYFLQRSMETRESAYRLGQTYRSEDNDEVEHHMPLNNNA